MFDGPVQNRKDDEQAVIAKQIQQNTEMVFLSLLVRVLVIRIDLFPEISAVAALRVDPIAVHTAPVAVIRVEAVLVQNSTVDFRLDLPLFRVRVKPVERIFFSPRFHIHDRPGALPDADSHFRIPGSEQIHQQFFADKCTQPIQGGIGASGSQGLLHISGDV